MPSALWFALLLTAVGTPSAAGQPGARVAGTWRATFDREVPATHLAPARAERREATLTLAVRGDSVFGHWTSRVADGTGPTSEREIRGVVRGDVVHAELLTRVPSGDWSLMNLLGTAADSLRSWVHGVAPRRQVLELALRGDSLVGGVSTRLLDGTLLAAPTEIRAGRVVSR